MLKAMKGNDNMRYGIICAMDEELKDLLENLEDRTDKKVGVTEFYREKSTGKKSFWYVAESARFNQALRRR